MSSPDTPRGIFSNRTLNLRRIQAIGYDMDYALVHYHMRAWEQRAYNYLKERLDDEGWPAGDQEGTMNEVREQLEETGNKISSVARAANPDFSQRSFTRQNSRFKGPFAPRRRCRTSLRSKNEPIGPALKPQ